MRMRIVVGFILLFFIFLLSRVYYLSIKSNVYYEELARQNAIKTQNLAPTRGQILDRNGVFLALNDLGFSISIKPYLSIKKSNQEILNKELNTLTSLFTDLNATILERNYKRNDSYYNQNFIEVIDFVPYEKMMPYFSILHLNENIEVKPVVRRKYPFNSLASHIIGYVGKANLQDVSENEIAKLTNYIGRSGIERYYNEMIASFDIQDADTTGTLILICKTYLKMNTAIDCGDMDGFQKLSRVYDSLRKSAKFTAAQNKETKNDFVDSVGEIVALCEKEGFIPRFATDIPQDKVDITLKDMNNYVKKLVTQDLGFGQQIEDSIKKLQIQKEMRNQNDDFDFEDEEASVLKDADYEEK